MLLYTSFLIFVIPNVVFRRFNRVCGQCVQMCEKVVCVCVFTCQVQCLHVSVCVGVFRIPVAYLFALKLEIFYFLVFYFVKFSLSRIFTENVVQLSSSVFMYVMCKCVYLNAWVSPIVALLSVPNSHNITEECVRESYKVVCECAVEMSVQFNYSIYSNFS